MKAEHLIASLLVIVVIITAGYAATSLTGYATASLEITDIKMAKFVNDRNQPVDITTTYPSDAGTIYCWFSYTGAPPNEILKGSWYYENSPLADSVVELKKSTDVGHFRLRRTTENLFPIGNYRVDISVRNKVFKNISFSVI